MLLRNNSEQLAVIVNGFLRIDCHRTFCFCNETYKLFIAFFTRIFNANIIAKQYHCAFGAILPLRKNHTGVQLHAWQ